MPPESAAHDAGLPLSDSTNQQSEISNHQSKQDRWYLAGGWRYTRPHETAILAMLGLLDPPRRDLLDVGCGDGFHASILAEVHNVLGVDLSAAGVRIARERGCGAEFIHADALDPQFAEKHGAFEIVFARGLSPLSRPVSDPRWPGIVDRLAALARERVVYVKWNVGITAAIHKPADMVRIFGRHGSVCAAMYGKYIVVDLDRRGTPGTAFAAPWTMKPAPPALPPDKTEPDDPERSDNPSPKG